MKKTAVNKFSIIVPVFNCEKYIERCIQSIILQSYKNIEIIIVDDGSKDCSCEICERLASEDSRIKFIKQNNKGVSCARNIAIENATGNYITFVDSDDFLEENAIEVLNNALSADIDLLIAEICNIANGERLVMPCVMSGTYTVNKMFEQLLNNKEYVERINSVCAKVYKLEIIKKNNIRFDKNIKIGEDLLFNINYLNYAKKIKWIKDKIYNYYLNDVSCTQKYIEDKYIQLKTVNGQFEKLLKSNKSNTKLAKYVNLKNIYSCYISLFNKNCKLSFWQKVDYIKTIKNKEKKIILEKLGYKYLILSLIHSFLPAILILAICKIIEKIRNRPKKPIFIRAYLRKNLGDDLFVKTVTEKFSNVKFEICSNFNYKNIFGKNVKAYGGLVCNFINKSIQLLTLKRYSLVQLFIHFRKVIIWIGGSIFMETTSTDKYTIKMPKNKSYYILGSNFGPYKTKEYLDIATNTFKNAKDVCFRESYSYEKFSNLSNVRMAPDLAFNLDLSKTKIENKKRVVISVINCKNRFSKEISNAYEKNIANISEYFVKKDYEVVLMSFCKIEGDEKAIYSILKQIDSKYKEKVNTYFYRGNIQEALNVIGSCQIVIATRFHATILAISLEKIVIPIIYSKKTLNFLQDINFKGKYIDILTDEKIDIENIVYENTVNKRDSVKLKENAKAHFKLLDRIL